MKKLNLGSGEHVIDGWDNLDLVSPAIICDLTKPLPYADASVSHIFSEHFIEHLDEVDGFLLMKECCRVLISGGKLRFCCPDLRQYVDAYLDWSKDSKPDKEQFTNGVNFINFAILGEAKNGLKYLSPIDTSRDEGHKYYYDEDELRRKLTAAGFCNVIRCEWKKSNIPEFQNLEWRKPMRDLIVEATKG